MRASMAPTTNKTTMTIRTRWLQRSAAAGTTSLAARVLLLIATLAAGCSTPDVPPGSARRHVISADFDGAPIDPMTRERLDPEGGTENFAIYVRNMLEECDRSEELMHPRRRTRRVLLHIHGGLNGHVGAVENAIRRADEMLAETDPEDQYYPISITWPSQGLQSYGEHLFVVRQGQRYPIWARITSPIFLISDIAEGIVHLPRTWYYQAANDLNHSSYVVGDTYMFPTWRRAEALYEDIRQAQEDPLDPQYAQYAKYAHRVHLGTYERSFLSQAGRFVSYWATLPLKLIATGVVLDGMARSSWDIQQRTARNLMHRGSDFELEEGTGPVRKPANGTIGVLLEELRCHVARECKAPDVDYEIVLVAHSLGTMVVNDLLLRELTLQELGADGADPLPITKIIYLSAAASVRDTARILVPYLARNPHAHFYNLTLHPSADADEMYPAMLDAPPRGSLLEWIDNFYTRPPTPADRTMGKWVNTMLGLHLFEEVMKQVTLKSFDVGNPDDPETHSGIHAGRFWKRDYWMPPADPAADP